MPPASFSRFFLHSVLLAGWLAGLSSPSVQAAPPQETPVFYIREYRVSGATLLPPLEIQRTVYPYLGPARTTDDVENARLALEAAYRAKGYQTVSVLIPQQDPRYGLIRLEVAEGKVGRLRVHGAGWFLPSRIKAAAPSLAEGRVPDLEATKREILALNRHPDRKVVPSLRAGVEPGTVDIDLQVEDKRPVHGSLEFNNLYSTGTSRLRVNGALSHDNLFQLGQSAGLTFQAAPENTDDSLVYSGFYQARVNDLVSLRLQATRQASDIATVGGAATVGKGETYSLRALFDLPYDGAGFQQTLSLGADYKDLEQTTLLGSAPVDYLLLSGSYGANWLNPRHFTAFNLSANLSLRGAGTSDESDFDRRRYEARGSFLYLRADFSHTADLKNGSQLFGRLQGQLADGPLLDSEQFSGGGFSTARGYLESSGLGDNGLFATFEYRTPSFIGTAVGNGPRDHEWRIHTFLDGGILGVHDALPGQDDSTPFLSTGIGTRVRHARHFNGSLDLAIPLIDQADNEAFDPLLIFRGWADF